MKLIVKASVKYIFQVYSILRLWFWDIIKSKRRTINLSILRNNQFKLIRYGDIARILYSEQHLIPFRKSFEYTSLELFYNSIHPGDVVLDIGANVGVYSLLASKKIGPEGRIYAFEPTKATYELLLKNIALNQAKNIIPVKKALSDANQRVLMRAPEKWVGQDTDGFNKMVFISDHENNDDVLITERLDDFVKQHSIQKINIIKVDIEGAEFLFFKGAKNVLLLHKPLILFEALEEHCRSFNNSVIDVLVYLHELGYKLEQINREQWLAK